MILAAALILSWVVLAWRQSHAPLNPEKNAPDIPLVQKRNDETGDTGTLLDEIDLLLREYDEVTGALGSTALDREMDELLRAAQEGTEGATIAPLSAEG